MPTSRWGLGTPIHAMVLLLTAVLPPVGLARVPCRLAAVPRIAGGYLPAAEGVRSTLVPRSGDGRRGIRKSFLGRRASTCQGPRPRLPRPITSPGKVSTAFSVPVVGLVPPLGHGGPQRRWLDAATRGCTQRRQRPGIRIGGPGWLNYRRCQHHHRARSPATPAECAGAPRWAVRSGRVGRGPGRRRQDVVGAGRRAAPCP